MTDTSAATRGLTSQPAPPPPTPPALTAAELLRWAWRQLTSMRTALILLLLLGLAAIPGSLIPQSRVDARAVSLWQLHHPGLTPLYQRLGLFHVYGSVWFSAIYILLMVSLIGCILPRLRVYWRALTKPPPAVPRNLSRLPAYRSTALSAEPADVTARAGRELRRLRFRVRITGTETAEVAAQRGYLREAGNLLFHLSVVLVLVAFAVGNLFGFRGGVIVVDGQTFTNTAEAYDDFAPGALFGSSQLEPFNFTLDKFSASFVGSGPEAGIPSAFDAALTYRSGPGAPPGRDDLQVNHPLTIGSTSVFLVGNGYAPVVTVRDGIGKVVYSGPTVFLPLDPSYASVGVIKAADAQPEQLGFDGQFLPTYGHTKGTGVYSQFPDTLAPVLSLKAYAGNLGLDSGTPQSVYVLDKSRLTAFKDRAGRPLTLTIPMGATRKLPQGAGSITFNGVRRWAKLQISATPAEPLALGGVVLALVGLLGSLYVRPRRVWLRIRPDGPGSRVELAGLDRLEGDGLGETLDELVKALTKETT